MAENALRSWDSVELRRIVDSVLIRSGIEFRRALRLLQAFDSVGESPYVAYMREGLEAIEAELARRGVNIETALDGEEDAGSDRKRAPRSLWMHERQPVVPPRTRSLALRSF